MARLRPFTRRKFMKHASLAAGAALVPGGWLAAQQAANYVGAALPEPEVPLYWLDGEAPKLPCGATWGVPWPKGQRKHVDNLDLQNQNGQSLPVQHGVLARWPDGSIKWSVHSTPPNIQSTARLRLQQGKATLPEKPLQVQAHGNTLVINTGALQCTINQQGPAFIAQCSLAGGVVATQGRLLLRVQNLPQPIPGQPLHTEELVGQVEHAVVEQKGPVLAVIKLSGQHVSASGKRLIPFVVRLYFYAGSQSMRMVHSMVYDADEQTTFINGLGVQFAVPLDDEPYNRHIRFGGQAAGVFAEAVQGLTGLRRDAGTAVRQAQMTGQQVPPVETWPAAVRQGLPYIPKFGDYTLSQLSSQGFTLKKRTSPQHGWVTITQGQRANGLAYLGTPKGGLAMGLQHFWQSHPAQLDVSDAHTPVGKLTLWLWSPEAPPMDLRFYHDGMGQDPYEKQLAGLDITYEDYEPGFGTPQGIARTSELMCWFLNSPPSNQTLAQ
ncbi:MAG TPA: twin-arginine translocation signal domain-containing protein, partial [Phnomibacter sp.]|nr:twin-arginine translocation signal domain-containing protein [Phnomibacter sp.]